MNRRHADWSFDGGRDEGVPLHDRLASSRLRVHRMQGKKAARNDRKKAEYPEASLANHKKAGAECYCLIVKAKLEKTHGINPVPYLASRRFSYLRGFDLGRTALPVPR
ncbi:MAG TPA: hypothetical protein VIT00_07100 [Terrimicrobiaceae bacterium]